jgi:hypothetical protein
MNHNLDEIERELIDITEGIDVVIVEFVKSLKAFDVRLERIEKWIKDQRKRMLN